MPDYLEITCTFPPDSNIAESSEIVIALLSDLGFESFEEMENTVKAYIPSENFDGAAFSELVGEVPELFRSTATRRIAQENWNQLWESNFPMTEHAGRIVVYAPFHEDVPSLEHRICIMPQMSFGTGHHETTSLMLEMMLDIDLSGKKTLDMGCGTGILAIFAAMKKAASVTAIDIDEWSCRNAAENRERNPVGHIEILQGDSSLLRKGAFDMILANINRNVLTADMATYANSLSEGGMLQISGFYTDDFPEISAEAERNGLALVKSAEKKRWMAALYRKNKDVN